MQHEPCTFLCHSQSATLSSNKRAICELEVRAARARAGARADQEEAHLDDELEWSWSCKWAGSCAKGIKPTMARLTLARKMAAITLTLWKKGASFDAEKLKPGKVMSVPTDGLSV